MPVHPLAGTRAPAASLPDVTQLRRDFLERRPGSRATRINASVSAPAVTAERRSTAASRPVTSPPSPRPSVITGADRASTVRSIREGHARGVPAGGVDGARGAGREWRETVIQRNDGVTPTPVISARSSCTTQPPRSAGGRHVDHPLAQSSRRRRFKYNPPHGGPADADVTEWIQARANELLAAATSMSDACRLHGAHGGDYPPRKISSLPMSTIWRCHRHRQYQSRRRADWRGSVGWFVVAVLGGDRTRHG